MIDGKNPRRRDKQDGSHRKQYFQFFAKFFLHIKDWLLVILPIATDIGTI
jgi:hypothetical protein